MISLALAAVLATSAAAPSWHSIVSPNLEDCTFVMRPVKGSQSELRKINSDFAASYRFSYLKVYYKEPLMLRAESRVEGTDLYYMISNGRKKYVIPKVHISTVVNIAHAPGKRQTMMDFGLLTPSLFADLMNAEYIRTEPDNGDLVFDLTYRADDRSRYRVWVDPEKRYITKRVWFAQDGHEMATFTYSQPQEVNGVWFPTRGTVRNADRVVAGITELTQIHVNAGLEDRLFKT